jgi:hypothetical protein
MAIQRGDEPNPLDDKLTNKYGYVDDVPVEDSRKAYGGRDLSVDTEDLGSNDGPTLPGTLIRGRDKSVDPLDLASDD